MSETKNEKYSLPLIITRGEIIFPGVVANINVGRIFSVAAMNLSQSEYEGQIVVTSQNDISVNEPTSDIVYTTGCLCKIDSVKEVNGIYRLRISAVKRVSLTEISTKKYNNVSTFMCEAEEFPVAKEKTTAEMNNNAAKILQLVNDPESSLPRPIVYKISKGVSYEELTNQLIYYLDMPYDKKQEMLEESKVSVRLEKIAYIAENSALDEQIEKEIVTKVAEKNESSQREYILKEKMRVIQDELDKISDDDDSGDSCDKYLKKLEENPYPANIKKKVKEEINHFRQLPSAAAESGMIKAYIDTMMSIPWFEESEDDDDINHAEQILNEDHYGLEKVKERILEYLAVKNVTKSLKAPILCLYGPPGTGKTSLAKSVARALNRKFVKASLGGTSDEAEIRGHRRTYVASMPGKIIKGMKTAGTVNPVFLLDEIDKMTSNIHGDPASALLEVLDPEQNSVFQDNYLEETYDLSKVLFIATANYLENIPAPLRDRLELIELNTYTNEEKYHIAVEHLIPKQCANNGIDVKKISFNDSAIYYIMDYYTREAGVRELERKIGTIIRKSLVAQLKAGTNRKQVINIDKVKEYLGIEIFDVSKKEAQNQVGVVTGLAYTQFGGDILPIEVNYFPGKGGLVLTGSLGDVMKESAAIAVDYVRANAQKYGIEDEIFSKNDIHIHFPEGAVPKDGPSAGVAITVCLISALSGKKASSSVAMTGEVSLRGKALPIGGLKEKSLAAYRSGIKKVLIPRENQKNLQDIPQVVKDHVEFVLLDSVDDAVAQTLAG